MAKQEAVGWAPNQVVARNMTRARELRGLTQVEVADRLALFTGNKWSQATVAQAEGTVHGGRMRNFTINELYALARSFDLPILWFLVPPAPDSEIAADGVSFPDDAGPDDWRRMLLYALGHRGNYGDLAEALATWHHRMVESVEVPGADLLGDEAADREPLLAALGRERVPVSVDDAMVAALYGVVSQGLPGRPLGPDEVLGVSEGLRQVATALEGLANYSPGRTFRHLFEDEDEGADE